MSEGSSSSNKVEAGMIQRKNLSRRGKKILLLMQLRMQSNQEMVRRRRKKIVELARKKMRLEVEVKTKEMNGLKQKKEAAFDKATKLCLELEEVQKFIDAEKESLEQLKREKKSSGMKVKSFELQILELRGRIDAELLLESENSY